MYFTAAVLGDFELSVEHRAHVNDRLRLGAGEPRGAQYVVMEGHPAVEIARAADRRNADLIVMSTKGTTGAEWLLVGSVTERVCRMANVPVGQAF